MLRFWTYKNYTNRNDTIDLSINPIHKNIKSSFSVFLLRFQCLWSFETVHSNYIHRRIQSRCFHGLSLKIVLEFNRVFVDLTFISPNIVNWSAQERNIRIVRLQSCPILLLKCIGYYFIHLKIWLSIKSRIKFILV